MRKGEAAGDRDAKGARAEWDRARGLGLGRSSGGKHRFRRSPPQGTRLFVGLVESAVHLQLLRLPRVRSRGPSVSPGVRPAPCLRPRLPAARHRAQCTMRGRKLLPSEGEGEWNVELARQAHTHTRETSTAILKQPSSAPSSLAPSRSLPRRPRLLITDRAHTSRSRLVVVVAPVPVSVVVAAAAPALPAVAAVAKAARAVVAAAVVPAVRALAVWCASVCRGGKGERERGRGGACQARVGNRGRREGTHRCGLRACEPQEGGGRGE